MTGSVVVKDENGGEPTPTPTPTATVSPTPTPEPPRDTTPAPVAKPWATVDKPGNSVLTVTRFLKGRLTITARCASAGSGKITLKVSNAVADRIGLDGNKLGSADVSCNQHNRASATVKPNAKAKRALEDYRRSVKVTVALELAGPTGQITATRTINLKGRGRR
jgi:hypothetical protein